MTAPVRQPPAGPTAEQVAIAAASQAAFQQQQAQLRAQLAAALAAVWVGVAAASAFNPAAAARFVNAVLPTSLGAQRAMVALTVAHLNRLVLPPTPIVVAPATVTGAVLRGRDPVDYYERPFREIKWRLSQGKTLGQALDAGRRRAESIAQTDLQLAHTHTARSYIAEAQERVARQRQQWSDLPPQFRNAVPRPTSGPNGTVVGWRRVLSNNPNHCALCILATTQRYRKPDLLPIHPGCGCTVAPLFDTDERSDTRVLDPSLAQEIHNVIRRDLGSEYVSAGGGVTGEKYAAGGVERRYRDIVIVREHGELGPVLGVRGHHFERDPNRPGRLGNIRVNPEIPPTDIPDLDAL